MKHLSLLCALALGCSDYANIAPNRPVPAWEQDEVSCDTPPPCDEHPAKCVCTDKPDWQLQDINPSSDQFMTTYGLEAFDEKVLVVSFYKINCDFCRQQMGYRRTD